MDIVAYLRLLRRHWKVVAALTVVGAFVGAGSALATDSGVAPSRAYSKATHTLFLDTTSIQVQFRPIYTNLDQIAVLATTGDVPRRVAARLGGEASEWSTHVYTITNTTTSTLDIACAADDAADAVACADAFAEELVASLEEREAARFDAQLDDTLKRLDSIEAEISDLQARIAGQPANVDLLEAQRRSFVNQYTLTYERLQQLAEQGGPARVLSTLETAEAVDITKDEYDQRIALGRLGQNRARADTVTGTDALPDTTEASGPRFSDPVSRGSLGALLGLMLGLALAVAVDRVDRRMRSRDEVEAAFGMPVLTEVPALTVAQQRERALLARAAPLSRTAESYRAVRSSLMFQRATDPRPARPGEALVILVGSAGPKEGKTTTSANLATVFAESGQRVLAVNCDFRRPALHGFFDLPYEPRQVLETTVPGLWVVADVTARSGRENPAFVLEEQRRFVASARTRFDVIVLDTAPMLTTNDATEIMTSADLVLTVCRSGVTTIDSAHRVRELLSRISAPVAGVVFLGSEASPNDYYYYYARGSVREESKGNGAARTDEVPGTRARVEANGERSGVPWFDDRWAEQPTADDPGTAPPQV